VKDGIVVDQMEIRLPAASNSARGHRGHCSAWRVCRNWRRASQDIDDGAKLVATVRPKATTPAAAAAGRALGRMGHATWEGDSSAALLRA